MSRITTTETRSTSGTVLSLRLPDFLAARVHRVADREGNPLAAAVRRLIMLGLEAEEQRSAR